MAQDDSARRRSTLTLEEDVNISQESIDTVSTMLSITPLQSRKLLSRNNNSIDLAVNYYRFTAKGLVLPPDSKIKLQGFENSGNSCYISSLLFSLFARNDAFDWILLKEEFSQEAKQEDTKVNQNRRELQTYLRFTINLLRNGELVTVHVVSTLRDFFMKCGWEGTTTSQEDACEFYNFLMELFEGPFIPMKEIIYHGADKILHDIKLVTQRVFSVSLLTDEDQGKDEGDFNALPVTLEELIRNYFYTKVEGLNRPLYRTTTNVDAWKTISLLPFYTNPDGEKLAGSDTRMILPIQIKRYDFNQKTGTISRFARPVLIPYQLDFSNFVINSPLEGNENFILQLKSAVCHLGEELNTGHYISYTSEPTSVENMRWLRLDDSSQKSKIQSVSTLHSIATSFYEEMGTSSYLLFYEILPMSDALMRCTNVDSDDYKVALKLQMAEYDHEMAEKMSKSLMLSNQNQVKRKECSLQ